MPGLQVNGKRTFPLTTALIHVAGRVVEHAQHRNDPVRGSVGPLNVCTCCPDVVNAQTNPPGRLRNLGRLFQGIINTINGVVLHGEQETARHLGFGRTGVEQRRGCVGKPLFRQQIVGLNGRVNIFLVNSNGYPHQHVLWAFGNASVNLQQVRFFEGFVAKIIITVIAIIDDRRVQQSRILANDFVHFPRNQRCILAGFGVFIVVQFFDRARKRFIGLFMEVGNGNPGRQNGVIRMFGGHRSSCFGRQIVELCRFNAVVEAADNFYGDFDGLYISWIEAIA